MADIERALPSPHMGKELNIPPVQETQQQDTSPAEKTPVLLPPADADQRPPLTADNAQKNSSPDPVDVPKRKAFKYLDRYRSPTDLMMSPVSRGLLARNRKTAALPMHEINQQQKKVLESKSQDAGFFPA
ncbi:uncharacterized protein LOC116259366 [Nymphaea colorata]|nr:uncharacterized protein LOC116259366 [Nymphaea colorata]